jgi:hypothetical protein
VDGVDDLGVVNAAQVGGGDHEIGMPELALDDQQRDTLAGHLDGLSVSGLVGERTVGVRRRRFVVGCESRPITPRSLVPSR